MATKPQTLTRITAHVWRKPDMSPEEFYKYWYEIHGPLAAHYFAQYGVVAYRQYHTPIESRNPGLSDADGMGDVVVKTEDVGKFMKLFEAEDYLKKVAPDEERFLDRVRIIQTMGVEYEIIRDGVNVHAGKLL